VHPSLRHQLRRLDQVLLSLLDERARLVADVAAGDPGRKASVDDLLARHAGPFPAEGVTEVFRAIDRHCAGFAKETPEEGDRARSDPEPGGRAP
jgi:chorismate mutase